MSRFQIMKAKFPDPSLNPRKIRSHLTRHLMRVRAGPAGGDLPEGAQEKRQWSTEGEDSEMIRLSLDDMKRVDRHAARLHEGVLADRA